MAGNWNDLNVYGLAVVLLGPAARAAPIAFFPVPGYVIVAYILREGTATLF